MSLQELKKEVFKLSVSDRLELLQAIISSVESELKPRPNRQVAAVRLPIYESFFQRRFIMSAVERYQLRLVIYDVQREVIHQWL